LIVLADEARRIAANTAKVPSGLCCTPVIGFFLIVEMAHASDMRRMAVLFRPVDGFVLRFESSECVVGVIFDHIIVNGATFGAALGSRLNINVRHASISLLGC
jgi:hypothetical protein